MTDPRLDTVLRTALARLESAMSAAASSSGTVMGQLALSSTSNAQRQLLMDAEHVLQKEAGKLQQAFSRELQQRVDKETKRQANVHHLADTDWDSLALVDNAEVERGVAADRLAQQLAAECDKTLESLNSYLSAVLDDRNPEHNPLRPQIIAKAWLTALGDLCDDLNLIQVIVQHMGRQLSQQLTQAYEQTTQELKSLGVQPQALTVQRTRSHASAHDAATTRPGTLGPDAGPATQPSHWSPTGSPAHVNSLHGGHGYSESLQGQAMAMADSHWRAAHALSEMFGVSLPSKHADGPAPVGLRGVPGAPGAAGSFPPISSDFQNLLRQLSQQGAGHWGATFPGDLGGMADPGAAGDAMGAAAASGFAGPLMAPNLIRAHRDELVRASGGAALDQMVIDIVAALFDQVLSDPKVPPEAARQIARLQMPVLRVALGDMSFFHSRKHPVRRFVNRIASLSTSFESFQDSTGQAFLAHVTMLVNDVVDGDFDDMAIYETKLKELESFVEAESERDVAEQAAVAALLNNKEADLRVQQRYMQILRKELADIDMPEFVRDFLAQIWSQVQVTACAKEGSHSTLAQRMRQAGHDLVTSVQPKGSPQLRKDFLLKLPKLMKDLNEGLAMIQWSEDAKKDFFAQLLPAHATCLKAAPPHELTQRLQENQLNKVDKIAIPSREEAANDPLPNSLDNPNSPPLLAVVTALSPEEVQQAGFVHEAAITVNGDLDINLDAPTDTDPSLAELDINLDVPPPPAAGIQLVHHIQKGTAYQMNMQGQWKKVRLTWVSEGRTFFIFTQGHMHKQTISLTGRTLAKMCETGRFKAYEQSELIERATVRARRQLAALAVPKKSAA